MDAGSEEIGQVVQTCRGRAAGQYMNRWLFVKEKEKRRALEVQNVQQLKTPLGPRPGRGGEEEPR